MNPANKPLPFDLPPVPDGFRLFGWGPLKHKTTFETACDAACTFPSVARDQFDVGVDGGAETAIYAIRIGTELERLNFSDEDDSWKNVPVLDGNKLLAELEQPTATIDEAVEAFERGECVHFVTNQRLYQLMLGYTAVWFAPVNAPNLCRLFTAADVELALQKAIDRSHDLYIAPSLSTALNAYDL